MKTQSKQQLRDEIVTLTMRNKTLEIKERAHEDLKRTNVELHKLWVKRIRRAEFVALVSGLCVIAVTLMAVIW